MNEIPKSKIRFVLKKDDQVIVMYEDNSYDWAVIPKWRITPNTTSEAVKPATPKTKKSKKTLNGFKSWTPYEDARLLKARRLGYGFSAIAKTLGRTSNGCAQRYSKLNKEDN